MNSKADGGLKLTLDHNGEIPVTIMQPSSPPNALPSLQVTINVSSLKSWRLLGAESTRLMDRFGVTIGGKSAALGSKQVEEKDKTKNILLNVVPNLSVDGNAPLTITLDGEPIVTAIKGADGSYHLDPARAHERLMVSELRTLSFSDNILTGSVPFPREKLKGFDPKKHAPITDVHTHSSAQIRPMDLIEISKAAGASYPVELMELLGINVRKTYAKYIAQGRSFEFKPLAHEELACEKKDGTCDVVPLEHIHENDLKTIAQAMAIAQDNTLCLSQFESKMYRFCNPLVKNPAITKPLILKIASEYKRMGVQYAELSTGSMIDDISGTWMKNMIEAVDEAEKDIGVQLRFLIGMPRSKPPHAILYDLKRIKFAARHPYIVGIDLYGYEYNKTSDFNWALEHMAAWADSWQSRHHETDNPGWNFHNNFLIRVHASETSKNHQNLRQVFDIAKKHNIRMRAAHAIRAEDNEAVDQEIAAASHPRDGNGSDMQHPLFGLEFCPDSNLAYNHIRHINQVPYDRWLNKAGVKHWFLATDGLGSMRTSPQQLALSALAGGVTLEQLEALRKTENRYIDIQQKLFEQKKSAFIERFGESQHPKDWSKANAAFMNEFTDHLKKIDRLTKLDPSKTLPDLPKEFGGKSPILLIGASGTSWSRIDETTQQEIKTSIETLVNESDPSKVYFVLGRRKDEGVTAILDDALAAYHKAHPDKRFSVLGLNTANQSDIASCITWIMPQPGGHDKVAENIAHFMKHAPKPGFAIAIGGSSYTGDIIKLLDDETQAYLQEKAEQPDACKRTSRPIPVFMMKNAEGVTKEFSGYKNESSLFENSETLLTSIANMIQSTFSCIFKDAILMAMPELPKAPPSTVKQPVFMDASVPIVRPTVFQGK